MKTNENISDRLVPVNIWGIVVTLIWCLCVGVFFFKISQLGGSGLKSEGPHRTEDPAPNPTGYYQLLTWSIANGHFELPIQPSSQLLALPDPYSAEARKNIIFPCDISYFNGKYYIYYGITPVLVLLLPWYLITGWFLPMWIAGFMFSWLGFLFSLFSLINLWRIARPNKTTGGPLGSTINATIATLSMAMGSYVAYILQVRDVYETAQECGYCFAMLGIWGLTSAWLASRKKMYLCIWLCIAGLALSMAVGSRPHYIFLGISGIIVLWFLWRSNSYWIIGSFAFLLPYCGYGTLLAFYNYKRFGSLINFGIQYVLNGEDQLHRAIYLDNVIINIRDYLILPPRLSIDYPYILPRWDWLLPSSLHTLPHSVSIGAFFVFPALVLVFALPIAIRLLPIFLKYFLGSLLLVSILIILIVSTVTHTGRYLVDFMSLAMLPSLILGFLITTEKTGWIRVAVFIILIASTICCTAISFLSSHFEKENATRFENAMLMEFGSLQDRINHNYLLVKHCPMSAQNHMFLGTELMNAGRNKDSINELKKATQLDVNYAQAKLNYGKVLMLENHNSDSVDQLASAIRLTFLNNPDALMPYGLALINLGRYAEAVEKLRLADQLNPGDSTIVGGLKEATNRLNNQNKTIESLRNELSTNAKNQNIITNLANSLFAYGDEKQAISLMRKSLVMSKTSFELRNKLSWMLATTRDHSLRNGEESVELSLSVNKQTDFKNPLYLETLAAAYAANGDFGKATVTCSQALDLANRVLTLLSATSDLIKSKELEETVSNLSLEMKLYENGFPYDLPGLTSPDTTPLNRIQLNPMFYPTIGSSMSVK